MAEPSIPEPESLPKPLVNRIRISGVDYELDMETIAQGARVQISTGDYSYEEEFDAWLEEQRQQIENDPLVTNLGPAPNTPTHDRRRRV